MAMMASRLHMGPQPLRREADVDPLDKHQTVKVGQDRG
jgi:hypothetical protein